MPCSRVVVVVPGKEGGSVLDIHTYMGGSRYVCGCRMWIIGRWGQMEGLMMLKDRLDGLGLGSFGLGRIWFVKRR